MTPLLPTYKDYTQNLIVMTSTDAKKLWRKAIKEANNYECIIAEKNIMNLILPLTMCVPDVWVAVTCLQTAFLPVEDVIKKKEV